MILTIKGADFSSVNIGTLDTYIISKSIGTGTVYDIPNFVTKNSSVEWTITLDEGFYFGTYSVTMGGIDVPITVDESTMTIKITKVTGNVRIVVSTYNRETPTIYRSNLNEGWQIMEFGDFKYLTNESTVSTFKSQVNAVDVSEYVGKTIVVKASQSYVKNNATYGDAFYSFFTSDAPNGIKPEDLPNLSTYETITNNRSTEIILDKSVIIQKFDVNNQDNANTMVTKVVTVPEGAKYLYFTSMHSNGVTADGNVIFN